MSDENINNFYSIRVNQLKEMFENNEDEGYSEKEKDYFIKQYQDLKAPIYYDYCEGWKSLNSYSLTIVMITTLLIGFIVAGIFASEKQLKTDSVFFASYYGRNKAIKSKLRAGWIIVSGIYWVTMLLYTIVILGVLGADGANCPIQIDFWKSIYNVTFSQGYIITLVGGYIGCLFISFLAMSVSSITKSSVISAIIPFILTLRPIFIDSSSSVAFNKILGLFPDQLLQIPNIFKSKFLVYDVFSIFVNQVTILIIIYSILFIVFYNITYRVYKKVEVK